MLLILDTNVYIFAFGTLKKPSCRDIIALLGEPFSRHKLRIPRTIIEEVRRNLIPEVFREFIGFILAITAIDENMVVPFEIAFKYEIKGLKPADAFIAAYAEWVGAGILVTENRHFLAQHSDLPFRVLASGQCLKLI